MTPTPVGNALMDRAYATDYPVAVGSWRPSSWSCHCAAGRISDKFPDLEPGDARR